MTHLITRARELAARERKLYDQRTIPAVLEELADEVERLTADRDEAQERARMNSFAGEGYVFMERRALAAEAEADKLRAEAANSAAQRDEAVLRATQAEERLRAVEADLAHDLGRLKGSETHWLNRALAAEAELSRIRNTTTKGRAL